SAFAFTPTAETTSVRPGGASENPAGCLRQMTGSRLAGFAVGQYSPTGPDTQNISGCTGGDFRYKKPEEFSLGILC
ncbi:hypothetical protein C7N83_06655, partial [Neisseria iguanae]